MNADESFMDVNRLRKYIKEFQFEKLFIEALGWDNPQQQNTLAISLEKNKIQLLYIAQISGVPILKFDLNNAIDLNKKETIIKIHKEIQQTHNKHLLCIVSEDHFLISYLSKENKLRTHYYFKNQSGDALVSKLSGIHFGIEEDKPKISEIGDKLKKAFDTEKVTKDFYKDFKDNHFEFQKYILGIESEEEKKWYSSILLNRLMFIWFLQKKGFVNNNDYEYLQIKLNESRKRGKDRYYSEFLTLLFFEGFARKPKERSEKAKKLLGQIKYLNGGLFVPHLIEDKYKNKIRIKDKAFEKTFEIFKNYEWHLQDNRGKDNEISPDVLGYIFEKYINEIQQKSLGAYYTRDEITAYLGRNTIQKCILGKIKQKGHDFQNMSELLQKLDVSLCKLLLTNEDSILNNLTILDPAVGSGAFLVSAMKELIDIYSPIIGKIETLGDRDLNKWLEGFKVNHKSIPYGIKKNIILKNLYGVDIMKEATEVCKLRLFLSLVSSALDTSELEPLPNMDFNIMHGNSLIGFLNEKETKTQLSVFGESYSQVKTKYNKLVNRYKNKSLSFKELKKLKNEIQIFLKENNSKLNQILADKCNNEGLKYNEIIDIQKKKKVTEKRKVCSEDFFSEDESRNLNPFHWDFAFNEIVESGGFDIIIANPPWEKVKSEDKEFFHKYDSSIDKKRSPKREVDKIKKNLLKDSNIKKDYFKTEEFYLFQSDYFSEIYKYQSGTILNSDGYEKQSSSDMDTYRLFMERCFELLKRNGFLGIVLPSGLCKDDGAIGLRRNLLFKKTEIKGLIDFQNQMGNGRGKIFEGVHPSFKFLLLNLKKDEPQDEFPCQFHSRDLKILETFPEETELKQSVQEINSFSPRDCSIIEFRNQKDKEIFKKANQFPELGKKIEDSWNVDIYGEFHETNDNHLFQTEKRSNKDLPLYKGGAIWQYKFNHDPLKANRYVNLESEKVQTGNGFAFKNECYKNYRLVIRDIARSTDERSLIAAIIPKNSFINNKLHGVHIELPEVNSVKKNQSVSKSSSKRLSKQRVFQMKEQERDMFDSIQLSNQYMLLLQAFLNSFIVDYFIRKKISSTVNKKYIAPLRVPRITEENPFFSKLVEKSALLTCIGEEFDELADEMGISRGGVTDEQKRWKTQGEIDAMVAHIYKLEPEEFKYILSTFNTGRNQERLEALKEYAFSAFEKYQNVLDEIS